jgi:hypothetical protein
MSDEELVKRLRPLSWSDIDARFGVPMDETMREAADRIEALTVELEFFEEEWVSAVDNLNKAVEALRYYAVEAMPRDADDSLIARTALAEIEEEMG